MGLEDLTWNWVEWVFLIALIAGLVFTIGAGFKPLSTYAISFILGLVVGRIAYRYKGKKGFWRYTLWSVGTAFLIAILVVSLLTGRWASVIFYLLGAFATYWLHEKEIIKSEEW